MGRGPTVRMGHRGSGSLAITQPPDQTTSKEKMMDPQRLPEDISGHPGSLPGAEQSSQGHVISSSLPCSGGRMLTFASGHRSEKPDNKHALTARVPQGELAVPRSHLSPRPRHFLASAVWHVIQRGSDLS